MCRDEHAPEVVHILAVDDTPENLLALSRLLDRPGLRVVQARSGEEALEALLADDIGLALMDVHMPGMDGFELAELIGHGHPDGPVQVRLEGSDP